MWNKQLTFFILVVYSSLSESSTPASKVDINRRFATSVVHENPLHPDQQAQSSIDFHLDTSLPQKSVRIPQLGKSTTYIFSTPRTIEDYTQQKLKYNPTQNYQIKHQPKPISAAYVGYPVHEAQVQNQEFKNYKQESAQSPVLANPFESQVSHNEPITYKHYAHPVKSYRKTNDYPQSQSFNVGYSVKFGNNGERGKNLKPKNQDPDVITGRFKEEVKRPSAVNFDEINPNIFIDTKKQKITGIKAKFTKNPFDHRKQSVSQSYVTPKTQKNFANLQSINGNNKFHDEIEQKVQASFQNVASSPWQNLSPTVEIYKSKELDLGFKSGFDHAKAMGNSEGFGFSDAMELKAVKHHVASPSNNYQQVSNPKLPIDTSLLREPVLTTINENVKESNKQIPIHFDTRLIQDMSNGNKYSQIFDDKNIKNDENINFQQFNNLLSEENKFQKFMNDNNQELKFNFPQNALFNPQLNEFKSNTDGLQSANEESLALAQKAPLLAAPESIYKVNENYKDNDKPAQTHFKVFSKPGNAFMRHEFEKFHKMRGEKSHLPPTPVQVQAPHLHYRQPRIQPKRFVRNYRLDHFKPPQPHFMRYNGYNNHRNKEISGLM